MTTLTVADRIAGRELGSCGVEFLGSQLARLWFSSCGGSVDVLDFQTSSDEDMW